MRKPEVTINLERLEILRALLHQRRRLNGTQTTLSNPVLPIQSPTRDSTRRVDAVLPTRNDYRQRSPGKFREGSGIAEIIRIERLRGKSKAL